MPLSVEHRLKISRSKTKYVIDKNGPVIEPESVQAKVHPDISGTRCWIVNTDRKTCGRYARKIWEQTNNCIKPKDKFLCHKCDNVHGHCVNPLHLFLGTNKENMQDCSKKGRITQGATSDEVKKSWVTRRKNGTDHWKWKKNE